jgi:hypothetical protein
MPQLPASTSVPPLVVLNWKAPAQFTPFVFQN